MGIYCILRGQIKWLNNSITTILFEADTFLSKKSIFYSINVLNFKGVPSVNSYP